MIQSRHPRPDEGRAGALENAASIAALLLTTEALIVDIPEDHRNAAPSMPEGGDF